MLVVQKIKYKPLTKLIKEKREDISITNILNKMEKILEIKWILKTQ